MSVERELCKITTMPGNEQGPELRKLAKKLCCSLQGLTDAQTGQTLQVEFMRRIREADRSRRESRLWIVALVAAGAAAVAAAASLCSAVAAWPAVLGR